MSLCAGGKPDRIDWAVLLGLHATTFRKTTGQGLVVRDNPAHAGRNGLSVPRGCSALLGLTEWPSGLASWPAG